MVTARSTTPACISWVPAPRTSSTRPTTTRKASGRTRRSSRATRNCSRQRAVRGTTRPNFLRSRTTIRASVTSSSRAPPRSPRSANTNTGASKTRGACLTAAYWLDLCPDLHFVICVRHPLEVALSLKRRNQNSYSLGLRLWEQYYTSVLEQVPRSGASSRITRATSVIRYARWHACAPSPGSRPRRRASCANFAITRSQSDSTTRVPAQRSVRCTPSCVAKPPFHCRPSARPTKAECAGWCSTVRSPRVTPSNARTQSIGCKNGKKSCALASPSSSASAPQPRPTPAGARRRAESVGRASARRRVARANARNHAFASDDGRPNARQGRGTRYASSRLTCPDGSTVRPQRTWRGVKRFGLRPTRRALVDVRAASEPVAREPRFINCRLPPSSSSGAVETSSCGCATTRGYCHHGAAQVAPQGARRRPATPAAGRAHASARGLAVSTRTRRAGAYRKGRRSAPAGTGARCAPTRLPRRGEHPSGQRVPRTSGARPPQGTARAQGS